MTVPLQSTIESLPDPSELPPALPVAHLSIAKWFENIVQDGFLKPNQCKFFNKDLLYFSYGGVFHRTDKLNTKDASISPIAFIFSHTLLEQLADYYPYDTGAAASGKYGSWSEELKKFDRYLVKGNSKVPSKLVHHIYGSNEGYIQRNPMSSCGKKPEPLPTLYQFLKDDLLNERVDHRKYAIECQFEKSVSLAKHLLWVGYPESQTDVFRDLLKLLPSDKPPKSYPYPSDEISIPDNVAADLEKKAKADGIIKVNVH